MEPWRIELPADKTSPDLWQCPIPTGWDLADPLVQDLRGWHLESDAPLNFPQPMPNSVHFQRTPGDDYPLDPLPRYQMPYPQMYMNCHLDHNGTEISSQEIDCGQHDTVSQGAKAAAFAQNAFYSRHQEERPFDWHLPSNQMYHGQDSFSFQRNPEYGYDKAIVQELAAEQRPHTTAVPYPVSPKQELCPYPLTSAPQMPIPTSPSLDKESGLMSHGWSSFDQPLMPSVAEPCQILPDLQALNYDPEWLSVGYQDESTPLVQNAIPASPHSPLHSHSTFKRSQSKESEQNVSAEIMIDQFRQTAGPEDYSISLGSSQLSIGFQTLRYPSINDGNQCLDSASFSEPPIGYSAGNSFIEPSLLVPPASSMNLPQPDVRTEPSIFDLPIPDHTFLLQPRKDSFSTSFDSNDVLLPLQCHQVKLLRKPEGSNEEIATFSHFLKRLRAKHPSSEIQSNSGLVSSIVTAFPKELLWVWHIPLTIVSEIFTEPIQTFPYVGSTVEELIHTTLFNAQQSSEASTDYVLKLCDAEEILQNPCTLGSHECLQYYLKLGNDIRLQLLRPSDLQRALARTERDDQSLSTLQFIAMETGVYKVNLSRKVLTSKLNSYHNELKSLLSSRKSTGRVVEEVKAICYMHLSVETKEITEAIRHLNSVVPGQQQASLHSVQLPKQQDTLKEAINELTAAISHLIHIFCNNFNTDYQVAHVGATKPLSVIEAQQITAGFSFNVYAVHGIPSAWAGSYENLFITCSLKYGGEELCPRIKTEKVSITKPTLFHIARWNQRICMPFEIRQLPCEATLNLVLHGFRVTAGIQQANKFSKNAETLASASMALYSSQQTLIHSTKLLCLIPVNVSQADILTLQIDFPDTLLVTYSRPVPVTCSQYVGDIDEVSRKQIANIQQKHSLLLIEKNEKELLWAKRSFCNSSNCFLPLLLGSMLIRDLASLSEIYAVLKTWSFSTNPLESLGLLLPSFSDQELRQAAVQQIGTILNDELLDYLPQLVQAIKFEWHLNSPLVELLVDRSIRSTRVAHQLYWLLKDGMADSQFKDRYGQLLAAVLCCSGQAMQEELDKETKLVEKLTAVAQKVCSADHSKCSTVLAKELEKIEKFFYQEHACRLPLNPAWAVKGIDVSACSYFTSNAVPLKLSFINADPLGKNINVIFKSGDDLRQDMLVLQMVKLMDRMWCQEGLSMSMIIYRCISTGRGRGMVEIIPGATTLAKIHMKHGMTGPFKESTLLKWFQEHNPTEELHNKAMENFVRSCAGWCVATFVLGVCDRHNDNIMVRTTGHMFHIDFGKFLGHAQMIGSVKRDRAPFIFTAEMEHFITEGGKNGVRFQTFVDLSCQAYNIIRQHTQLLMNLLELMLSAGLPELSEVQDLKYVYNNLRPMDSDVQATSYFTSLIKESLKCLPVKINFFAHNLAQKKFANVHVPPSLSFAPEIYTLETDGRIMSVLVCDFEKKMAPQKEYFYKLQVEREGQSGVTFLERSYTQFAELNKQLHCYFSALELPRFPYKPLIGLSKGRELARKKKDELNTYVTYLMNGSPQVAKSDLIYTFFHCFPNNERPSVSTSSEASSHMEKLSASTQLLISWENCKLSVMVKHIKNIGSERVAGIKRIRAPCINLGKSSAVGFRLFKLFTRWFCTRCLCKDLSSTRCRASHQKKNKSGSKKQQSNI
ncbi:phosphatidylinositol 3-kinase C2 domain-containing subunit gamma-like isoform X2 [Narcine bancroftii]|uniref:phosphatidylinositol 3-kinase C2 domain-containing subunit gamma-like isoform X2 n=1 Tax=Narcine bancroftii TaxID=1343680 RepID=UPI00383230B1